MPESGLELQQFQQHVAHMQVRLPANTCLCSSSPLRLSWLSYGSFSDLALHSLFAETTDAATSAATIRRQHLHVPELVQDKQVPDALTKCLEALSLVLATSKEARPKYVARSHCMSSVAFNRRDWPAQLLWLACLLHCWNAGVSLVVPAYRLSLAATAAKQDVVISFGACPSIQQHELSSQVLEIYHVVMLNRNACAAGLAAQRMPCNQVHSRLTQ